MSSTTLRQRRKEPIKEQEASVFSRPETQQAFVSFRLALLITTGIVIATLLLAYMTSPITAVGVEELTIVELTGPFELNRKLSKGKQILMSAPESIVEHKGNLYTGLADGRIVKIHPSEDGALGAGKVEYLTNGIIPKAEKTTEDINHGRALGIRIHDNDLYVADAIYGLYKLDLNSKEITILVRPSDTNPPMKFPDDLDITADGKIVYFSDASYRCPITTLINEALEGTCTSRIFKYHVFTHKLETVMTGLCFGNGVQLTKDEKTLIIPETTRYRVSWVDTTTWKTKHVLKIPAHRLDVDL
ncbi:adipocyte plasma membrane-associated protein-like isoform X2 [Clavelina lepadiformis]|uniref:adipocyte plasma membrane-associated protein-like isoform X2 n=1 Tax=Clavelina lepadiformis TaxID=159417 RepID=UPI0040412BC4